LSSGVPGRCDREYFERAFARLQLPLQAYRGGDLVYEDTKRRRATLFHTSSSTYLAAYFHSTGRKVVIKQKRYSTEFFR
jgi:hypothetical protein